MFFFTSPYAFLQPVEKTATAFAVSGVPDPSPQVIKQYTYYSVHRESKSAIPGFYVVHYRM